MIGDQSDHSLKTNMLINSTFHMCMLKRTPDDAEVTGARPLYPSGKLAQRLPHTTDKNVSIARDASVKRTGRAVGKRRQALDGACASGPLAAWELRTEGTGNRGVSIPCRGCLFDISEMERPQIAPLVPFRFESRGSSLRVCSAWRLWILTDETHNAA